MNTIQRLRIAATLVALTLVATAALGKSIEERKWIRMESQNFTIHSVLSEERTAELLRHLEIMRASLADTSSEGVYKPGNRTVILAVDNHEDYVRIGAPDYSAGFFFSDLRENAILISDDDESTGIQVILHEYAHYLNMQAGRIRYPRWYEEGNAEYLSHSRVHDQAFEFGISPTQHLATLSFANWLPLRTILQVTDVSALDETDGSLFYSQAWLLVHYLRSLPDADLAIPGMLRDYARLVAEGIPTTSAFAEAFNVEIEAMENALLRYFLEKQFVSRTVSADTTLLGFAPRSRELSKGEVLLALGQMALRFENIDGAEHWFNGVLPDAELRAHGEAGLGRVLGHLGDIDGASKHFDTAIHLMAWDFDIWMDYAQYWAQRVSTTYDGKLRTKYASRLIESLESALTISEATPELNSLMGFAYLAKGEDIAEAIEFLEAAAEGAPHDQASRLLLANAYLYVGRFDDAVDVAESVLLFEHQPGAITSAAHEVISEIERLGSR